MKHLMLSLAFITAAATAQAETTSFPPVGHGETLAALYSRDLRPADGDLREVALVRTADGLYTVSSHRAYYDRMRGGLVEDVKVIDNGFACTFALNLVVSCSVNNMPADGALYDLTIRLDDGGYTATLVTTGFSWITHRLETTTEVLGTGLERLQ